MTCSTVDIFTGAVVATSLNGAEVVAGADLAGDDGAGTDFAGEEATGAVPMCTDDGTGAGAVPACAEELGLEGTGNGADLAGEDDFGPDAGAVPLGGDTGVEVFMGGETGADDCCWPGVQSKPTL